MRRLPNSYLWLLEPTSSSPSTHTKSTADSTNNSTSSNTTTKASSSSDANFNGCVKHNLEGIMDMLGQLKTRLIFAPRAPKSVHIRRHKAADLFLDTFIYGAHSTATDALRGVSIHANTYITLI